MMPAIFSKFHVKGGKDVKLKNRALTLVYFLIFICLAFASYASESNPRDVSSGNIEPGMYEEMGVNTGYTDRNAWLADVGATTTLIDFNKFADGTQITTQLSQYGISIVSGTSILGSTNQFVTASTSLPFPMFTTGTLPSEPNFLSNDLSSPVIATGTITFNLTRPITAIGAYVADGIPLNSFGIEVFDGLVSLGFIEVPARTLPMSFVGIISSTPFDRATFYAVSAYDSWGLDNVELASAGRWGTVYKTLFDSSSDLELLREYRDDILTKTARGRKYKNRLYKHSEKALAVFRKNPELAAQAKDIIYANILAVDDVIHGQEGIIYNTDEIAVFLDAYAKAAPFRLKLLAKIVKWHMRKKQRKGKLFFGFRLE